MRRKQNRPMAGKKRLPKLIRPRNIIIVSEHGVDHIPLSAKWQWFGGLAVLAFICWISYTTGSYMAAESVIAEKDRKIFAAAQEKKRLGEAMLLMKRDLFKLHQTADDMTDYDKFVLNQYSAQAKNGDDAQYQIPGALFSSSLSPAHGANGDMMQQRVSFLEKQVDKLKEENLDIVMAVYDKTKDKIEGYEDVIAMTGLLPDGLMKSAAASQAKTSQHASLRPEDAPPIKIAPNTSGKARMSNQGGPLVEEETTKHAPTDNFKLDQFTPKDWSAGLDHLLIMQKVMNSLPLATPIRDAEVTSTFGRRVDPFRMHFAMHTGTDFSGPHGSKVLAANDGTVMDAGPFSAYGNAIDLDHGLGISTRYGHLSRILVAPGQHVKKGQVIGIQGSTGRSTGEHLHYEVRYKDQPINSLKFVEAGRYVLSQNR